jgi:hypothetical protein
VTLSSLGWFQNPRNPLICRHVVITSILHIRFAPSDRRPNHRSGGRIVFSWGRVIGALIIVIGLVALGGLAALGLGGMATAPPTDPLEAIAYGLGWQSTIGGLLNAKSSGPAPEPPSSGFA